MLYEKLSVQELIALIEQKDGEITQIKKKLAGYSNERRLRRVRQADGIQKAKESGVRFGRPKKNIPEKFVKVKALYEEHLLTVREAAAMLHVSTSTFIRWMKESK